MRKKVLKMLALILVLMGMTACGVETSENVEDISDMGATLEGEKDIKDELEVDEQEKTIPIWYMDDEGIKSEEVGILIRKDNGVLDNIEIQMQLFEKHSYNNWSVTYIDESLDEFIANYMECFVTYEKKPEYGTLWNKWEKYEFQNMSFAYGYDERAGKGSGMIVFIENGVMLYSQLADVETYGGPVEYLEKVNVIQMHEEVNEEYLVYALDDVLYCPALGVKVTCEAENNSFEEFSVYCLNAESTASVRISDEREHMGSKNYYMTDADNAQDVVDNFVNGNIDREGNYAIEGTVEKKVADYNYLGRGYWTEGQTRWLWGLWEFEEYTKENYLFYSDDSVWSIKVSYDKGNSYEDYLRIIESF